MNYYFESAKLIWKLLTYYNVKVLHKSHIIKKPYEVSYSNNFKIVIIPVMFDNYCLIGICENQAFVIDPPDSMLIRQEIVKRNIQLKLIFVTHHHPDHDGGVLILKKLFGSKIVAPEDKRIPGADIFAKDGLKINFANLNFEVLFTPGHTSSHVIYYVKNMSILFSGDLIFPFDYGGILDERDELILFSSLSKIRSLPDNTQIYCGHEYGLYNYRFVRKLDVNNSDIDELIKEMKKKLRRQIPTVPITLSILKKCNPFLRWDDDNFKVKLNCINESNDVFFHLLRKRKHEFKKFNNVYY